jgi:single-strand DNA-binding protein
MASFNRIVIMGNLTRDPEYKQLSSGQAVCKLGLASNRQFKNRQSGSMVQEVCYVDVDVWGAQAESCRQYLQKGRGVLIEGRLKYDSWEDPEGKTRSRHSIVADRVVFLNSQQPSESEAGDQTSRVEGARLDMAPEMDQELSKQINAVKARTQAKKVAAPKQEEAPSEGAPFVDEPPFQDDLPF